MNSTPAAALPLNAVDYAVFLLFVAALTVVGYLSGRGERSNAQDYYLAGRRLPWYVVGGSYIAANISTEQVVGMVGASYILGVSTALWDWLNVFTYIFMIFLFVPFLIRSRVVTTPEFLEKRFGRNVRQIFAVITVVANVVIFLAAVLYAGGLALSGFLGWPLGLCIVLTGVLAGGWAIYGGLSSVAWMGVFTAVIKFGGVGALSIFGLLAVSGNGNIMDGLRMVFERNGASMGIWSQAVGHSVAHLTSAGTYDRLSVVQAADHPMTPWTGLPFIILSVSIWYNVLNQFIIQRILGAKSLWDARMGIVFAGYLKLLLPVVTVLPGLILFALHPQFMLGDWVEAQHLADGGFVTLVGELLPVGMRGLLLAALFSAVQGTVSAVVNSTATVITFDIWGPMFRPHATDLQRVRAGIVGSTVTVTTGIFMALWVSTHSGGIFQYVQSAGAFFAPPFAAIFLLGLLWRGANSTGALFAILGGFAVAIAVKLVEHLCSVPAWFHPFANQAGIVWSCSIAFCIAGSALARDKNSEPDISELTVWGDTAILRDGLGERWYQSVPMWAAGVLLLTIVVMFALTPTKGGWTVARPLGAHHETF